MEPAGLTAFLYYSYLPALLSYCFPPSSFVPVQFCVLVCQSVSLCLWVHMYVGLGVMATIMVKDRYEDKYWQWFMELWQFLTFFACFVLFCFVWPSPWHMEVPRPGIVPQPFAVTTPSPRPPGSSDNIFN